MGVKKYFFIKYIFISKIKNVILSKQAKLLERITFFIKLIGIVGSSITNTCFYNSY